MSRPTPKQPGHISLARVLGEGVHNDPRAAYRELVDRAHDACERQVAADSSYTPAILVSTQTIGGVIHVSITDNGEAFEADAFRELYQVIQTGRSGAVRRALATAGAAGAHDVVGKFGAALLAAFVIADRVTIMSRHHVAEVMDGVKFTCDSRTYELEPCNLARAGTTVQLRVRKDRQRLGTVDVIREALLRHARTLPHPIRVGADPVPINE